VPEGAPDNGALQPGQESRALGSGPSSGESGVGNGVSTPEAEPTPANDPRS